MSYLLVPITKRTHRRGRGLAGRGGKSGRGGKGQTARAGYSRKAGFEGGQTPLYMRLPKGRGMKQNFPSQVIKPAVVTTKTLNRFPAGSTVTLSTLVAAGMVPRRARVLKLIGADEVRVSLKIQVDAATEKAAAAVKKAGGTIELVA